MSRLVIVAGKKGSGKTHWVRAAIANEPKLIVVDPLAEYREGGVTEGLPACIKRIHQLADLQPESYRVTLRVPKDDADEVLRALWGLQPGGREDADPDRAMCIVVEEADMVSAPSDRETGMDYLLQYGRHLYTVCYCCTRRPHRISRDATANADALVLFRTHEPRDLLWIEQCAGPAVAAQVRNLPAVKGAPDGVSRPLVVELGAAGGTDGPDAGA